MQTFVRVREQIHSNLVGLHVDATAGFTADRLASYRGIVAAHTADVAATTAQSAKLLATTVAQQASVLSFIDGFTAAAGGAFVCMLLVALMHRPPPSQF
jgi:DHA2 family multidrug resistance protein